MRIKIKPLSVNTAWQGRRFKTQLYKAYEKELTLKLPPIKTNLEGKLEISVIFGFSNKNMDLDNPLKPLIDVMQKKYNFNDRNVYKYTLTKEIVKKGDEFIDITIKSI